MNRGDILVLQLYRTNHPNICHFDRPAGAEKPLYFVHCGKNRKRHGRSHASWFCRQQLRFAVLHHELQHALLVRANLHAVAVQHTPVEDPHRQRVLH